MKSILAVDIVRVVEFRVLDGARDRQEKFAVDRHRSLGRNEKRRIGRKSNVSRENFSGRSRGIYLASARLVYDYVDA